MTKGVVVLSGGVESSTMLQYLVHTGSPRDLVSLTFNYGQRHDKEILAAAYQSEVAKVEHIYISLEFYDVESALLQADAQLPTVEEVAGNPQPSTYVPYRNMLFLVNAAIVAERVGAEVIYFGAQKSDQYGYWDTTKTFVDALNAVFGLNRLGTMAIRTPFIEMTKSDIIGLGIGLGVDYSHTWTCYAGNRLACGKCASCRERLKAFQDNNTSDPIKYEV